MACCERVNFHFQKKRLLLVDGPTFSDLNSTVLWKCVKHPSNLELTAELKDTQTLDLEGICVNQTKST